MLLVHVTENRNASQRTSKVLQEHPDGNFLQRKIFHIHNNPDGSQRQTHGEPLDEHVAASGGVDAFHTERTGCPFKVESLQRCGLMVESEPNIFDNVLL